MNQYKIGDTVWTRKRGKGRIVETHYDSKGYRPFRVKFNCNQARWYAPKAENLYPSEAAMFRDIYYCPISFKPKPKGHWVDLLDGKRTVTIDFSNLIEIKPDPIQPKFKVGDAVYLRGGKWTIMERYWSGTECRYNVLRPLTSDSDNLLAGITESDLRLWKETVLTHCLQIDGKTWYESDWKALAYKSIKYLGNIVKHDTFLVESHGGNLNLFRGIKGDDIEQTK